MELANSSHFRYNNHGSAPSSRTNSFKNKPRSRGVQKLIDVPRRNSMPDTGGKELLSVKGGTDGEPLRRVRSFKMTSKGIVNRGDTFRQSNSSLASDGSFSEHISHREKHRQRVLSESDSVDFDNANKQATSTSIPNVYRVALCGSVGVGKTALVNQFKTSEYMGGFEISIGDEDDEMTVSVLLDGEESTLEFHDVTENQDLLRTLNVDAYMVVFSVNNPTTFQIAKDNLNKIRKELKINKTIIIVANKIDLVRKRAVPESDAKKLADTYNCKYIETSVALNHQVDELLVGILRQIRLKRNMKPSDVISESTSKPKVKRSGALGLLDRLFARKPKSGSTCDNLYDA
ncbi:GTP-binding protein GEM-like [Saccostrea echinata]|uniref:GTP-binding protein GEM-like n=1 Tax=Saccostrea echinata TaxID=191078 RepID=UPI002A822631|nr:GTP-binding protein GEM-like [Saccostrea echinata]XP_061179715.1 GTP-binding protein GEM-like [Saccostrea echinata]